MIAIALMSIVKPAYAFLEFEKIRTYFKKKDVSRIVKIINYPDAPIQITEGQVSDKGSATFGEMTGVFHNFKTKVTNISGKKILSYRVSWIIRHPFESWVYGKVEANSIKELNPGDSQEISFRRDKHFRDDAYYFVKISEVEFDDQSTWEAPIEEETTARLDEIKKEIDAIKDKNIKDMSLDEIKEQVEKDAEPIKPTLNPSHSSSATPQSAQ